MYIFTLKSVIHATTLNKRYDLSNIRRSVLFIFYYLFTIQEILCRHYINSQRKGPFAAPYLYVNFMYKYLRFVLFPQLYGRIYHAADEDKDKGNED